MMRLVAGWVWGRWREGGVDVKCVYAPVENGAFSGLTVYILCRGGGLAERGSRATGKQESLEHR